MATKNTVSSEEKFQRQDFDLFAAIEAVDKKDYAYWQSLSEEQQRKFVAYMMLHWCSSVSGNRDLAAYYLLSMNHHANMHMFDEAVQNHPQLQWLMLCAGSPGIGRQRHSWIPHLSPKISQLRESAKRKDVAEYFAKIYPGAGKKDIDEFAGAYTTQQNHKAKLAKMYPQLKFEDIELLSQVVSEQDIKDYEDRSGI